MGRGSGAFGTSGVHAWRSPRPCHRLKQPVPAPTMATHARPTPQAAAAPTERRHGADPARPHPLRSRNGGPAKGVERAEGGERATASGSGRGGRRGADVAGAGLGALAVSLCAIISGRYARLFGEKNLERTGDRQQENMFRIVLLVFGLPVRSISSVG
jgi:hypothetical protein